MSDILEALRVPAFCPVCGWMMKGQKSISTYYDYGCCIECYIYWLDGKPQKQVLWKGGWRPSEEEVQQMKDFYNQPES